MTHHQNLPKISLEELRVENQKECIGVAPDPNKSYHFHMLNLTLDKTETLREWFRVLKPGGRLQVGDILVEREVPADALEDISLWTG